MTAEIHEACLAVVPRAMMLVSDEELVQQLQKLQDHAAKVIAAGGDDISEIFCCLSL